ncbi:hypothetical protein TNCV_904951 [Trichonephila clavipes]|nr:hypothetical protein TNCV_904951 [Trichonephila clavipes]
MSFGTRSTLPNSVYATLGPEVHEQMFWSGVLTASVREGKRIFGSQKVSKFSFEKKSVLLKDQTGSIVLTARVSEGKRFSEAVLQVNSASEKKSVPLKDQTDL